MGCCEGLRILGRRAGEAERQPADRSSLAWTQIAVVSICLGHHDRSIHPTAANRPSGFVALQSARAR
eukprot:6480511-Amphidinium_carterae.1